MNHLHQHMHDDHLKKPLTPQQQKQQQEDQMQEDHFRSTVKLGDDYLKHKKYHRALDTYQYAMHVLEHEMRGPENDKEATVFLKYRYYVIDSMRECYDMMEDYEQALQMCEKFFELEAWLRKLRVLDQWEESLNFLSAKKAEYLISLRRLKEASQVLRHLVQSRLMPLYRSDKRNEKTRRQLVFCLTQQGKLHAHWTEYDLAIRLLDQALKIEPHYSEALSYKCLCLMRMNRVEETMATARMVMDRHGVSSADYRCRIVYLEALLMRQKYDECVRVATTTLKLYPEDQLPYLYRAQAHVCKLEYRRSLEDVVQFEKSHGVQVTPMFNLDSSTIHAICLLSLCKFKTAEKLLRERLKDVDLEKHAGESHIFPLLTIQAIVYAQLGKFQESKQLFDEHILPRLESIYYSEFDMIIQVRNAFARTLLQSGEPTEAIAFMNKSLRLVDSLISDGTISKNRSVAMTIDEYYGLRAEISSRMGDAAQVTEMFDQLEHVLKTAGIDPSRDPVFISGPMARGVNAFYAKDYETAKTILKPLLKTILKTKQAYRAKEIKQMIQDCESRTTNE